jgi:hypothetical protein
MKFDKAEQVESVCYQMRLGNYPRGKNRALINNLFNGVPPYTDEEVETNNIEVNVNSLEGTRLAHEARSQFYQAFLKPGNYFTCRTDSGAPHKRSEYGNIVTREMNKIMKRSIPYMECFRSKFAMDVLHGIAPAAWRDPQLWRPDAVGLEDVYVPSNTLLTMINLPFFAIKKTFTAPELIKLTRGPNVDPAWNMDLVEACIEWVDRESMTLMSSNWPEIWSPEKIQERVKGDGGFYVGDAVPTINVFDFYFWSDDDKREGWKRRMILDTWSTPTGQGAAVEMTRRTKDTLWDDFRGQFLYNPDKRVFASELSNIITWQFADLSSVAPFRYHSVRSLGFLLYSVCHLQNRMRCKFSEAVFEQMLVYFRVKSMEDAQRVLKVDLVNRGFIDDTVDFVKAADRYQINEGLVEMGLNENRNLIASNSSSYTSQPQNSPRANVEKTKFEVMAETQAMTSLVSASLQQAYIYQRPEYREIHRRFTMKGSKDPEVRTFQANCLRQGLPDKILYNPECWEQEAEQVLGAGNKTLEMAIAQQLMQFRQLYDPEAQRLILKKVSLAITDDPGLTDVLVPDKVTKITDSVHDAQLAAGTLMQGLPVAVKSGMNHVEYVETLMHTLASVVQQGANTMERLMGMQMMAQNIAEHIALIAQNLEEKQRVAQYNQQMTKIMNVVKALGQKLQEKMQSQNGNGQDPEAQAKIQATLMQAKVKADSQATAHAQKTAQRQIQFEMEEKRKDEAFKLDTRRQMLEAGHGMGTRHAEHKHDLELRAAEAEAELEHEKALAEIERKKKAAAPKPAKK